MIHCSNNSCLLRYHLSFKTEMTQILNKTGNKHHGKINALLGRKGKNKVLKSIFKCQDSKSLQMHLQYLDSDTECFSEKFNELLNPSPIMKLRI
jgi:hypothetical protein